MNLKGRRQSKNVEVQTPKERKQVLDDQKLIRDVIANTNDRLKDKTPIANVKPNMNERMNTINPGYVQDKGGYKVNIRTLKETHKPQSLSKKQDRVSKDAKFFLK